ncbi:MAG: phosphate transport regulator [Rothia sp. (in: high G+C Gram-positive bacteria)]|nr:phosphate transport regulator [Rothia sp. (in: high G+C Gram-positive bacteria)]
MLHRLFPQNQGSLTALADLSNQVAEAAAILSEMVGSPEDRYPHLLERALTHEADTLDLLLTTMTAVRSSFSAPIPREDIYTLATSLNTAVEKLTSAANILHLYGIVRFSPKAATLLDLIQRQAVLTTGIIPQLTTLHNLDDYWITMLRITKQAVRIAEEYDAEIQSRYKQSRYLQTTRFIHKLLEASEAMRTVAVEIGRIIVQES